MEQEQAEDWVFVRGMDKMISPVKWVKVWAYAEEAEAAMEREIERKVTCCNKAPYHKKAHL